MTIPKQCEKCALLAICRDNDCMKEKPCASRTVPAAVDEDLYEEMKTRRGE